MEVGVMATDIPSDRANNREFAPKDPERLTPDIFSNVISMAYIVVFYLDEQGIFEYEQGLFRGRAGNLASISELS
jgi:hypothetical protein